MKVARALRAASASLKQVRVPAEHMRGGTSKGVFFHRHDLPVDAAKWDQLMLRVMGSPDPYEKQIDGMGGATSSTSKVVVLNKSSREGCHVDYLFGALAISESLLDWSGNCGNLSAAVGPYAIRHGWVPEAPSDGVATVVIWQVNTEKKIIAKVPMKNGTVQELGDFEVDGVTFPAAEVQLEFLDPGNVGAMFPTGHVCDDLTIPGVGCIKTTLIDAGNPTILVDAKVLGLHGAELQPDVNTNKPILDLCETVRSHAAVTMGLAKTPEEASTLRQHTPKLAFAGPAVTYTASSGKTVEASSIDVCARILSMGKLHHAMTGTGAVALAAAAAVPGTVMSDFLPGPRRSFVFGHPSGSLRVGAEAVHSDAGWEVASVAMSRTARRLMEGWVLVPEDLLG
mmetsp:Transcript_41129/g.74274  ORF Transcript_41129/g.74274 Transcript_41129/m.74274 type:complete len:397 (+) Transcript_41129:53-1243(+)